MWEGVDSLPAGILYDEQEARADGRKRREFMRYSVIHKQRVAPKKIRRRRKRFRMDSKVRCSSPLRCFAPARVRRSCLAYNLCRPDEWRQCDNYNPKYTVVQTVQQHVLYELIWILG